MTDEEFRKDSLKMLEIFADFCEKYNLRYILDYGTLLGAIRHKGFIPWDDDIDVSMPREDYDRLYQLVKKQDYSLDKNYKIASFLNKYSVQKPYLNLIDISTKTKSLIRKEKYFYPVWIDIFPCDHVSALIDDRPVKKYVTRAQYSLFEEKNKVAHFKYLLTRPFMKLNFRIAEHLAKKKNKTNTKRLHNFYAPYGMRDVMKPEYFDDYIYAEFEGEKFRIPRNYDERLHALYRDYMKLPPKDKRIRHVTECYYL